MVQTCLVFRAQFTINKKPYNILKVCNMRFIPIEAIVVDEPVVLRHLFLLYKLNKCQNIGYFRFSD